MESIRNNNRFILLSILILGFVLRVFLLTKQGIWFDEACSISFASNNFDIFSHRYLVRPVYFVLLKIWVALFGPREFAARFLSVIFGVLSVGLIYRLGKSIFDRKTGVFSAFILAVSSYHIYYSQQVRNYALFGFLGLASMILFVKLLKKNRKSDYVFYFILNIILLYTHPYGLFVVIVQNVYLILLSVFHQDKFINKKYLFCIIGQLIMVAIFLGSLCIVFKNKPAINIADFQYMSESSENLLIQTFEAFAYGGPMQKHGGLQRIFNYEGLLAPRVLSVIFIPLLFLGIFLGKEDNSGWLNSRQGTLFLLLWLALTITLGFGFSLFFIPVYLTRYLFATVPAFYILAARGLRLLPKGIYKSAALMCIIILSVVSLNIVYSYKPNADWRAAASILRDNIEEGDSVIFFPLEQIVPFWFYYKYEDKIPLKGIDRYGKYTGGKWNHEFMDRKNQFYGVRLGSAAMDFPQNLAQITGRKNDVWVIASPYWIGMQKTRFLLNKIHNSHVLIGKYTFAQEGAEIYRFRPGKLGSKLLVD